MGKGSPSSVTMCVSFFCGDWTDNWKPKYDYSIVKMVYFFPQVVVLKLSETHHLHSFPRAPMTLIFEGQPPQNTALNSNQNQGPHLGSRSVITNIFWGMKSWHNGTRFYLTKVNQGFSMLQILSPAALFVSITSPIMRCLLLEPSRVLPQS